MNRLIVVALVPTLALPLVTGCQGGDDGIDHAAVQQAQAPLKAAWARTGGDWSKLTADEKRLFIDRARGHEESAKRMFGMFGGGPPGGPPNGN